MVVLSRSPVVVTASGLLVRVQVPEDGSPLRATLPVATPQVGWVTALIVGAAGVTGWELITTEAEEPEVQPAEFLTLYV
jgi:hypothetical protein